MSPCNNHRKLIFDKFYNWLDKNSSWLPVEVTDVAAEIWNLEEECEFWRLYSSKLKHQSKPMSAKEHDV